MNNKNAEAILRECASELTKIDTIIQKVGQLDDAVPFLTKYALIKTSGAIEVAFKLIIGEYVATESSIQVKKYITETVIDSSINPSYDNICRMLNKFDELWGKEFKGKIGVLPDCDKLRSSLASLVEARNEFAHGGNPIITFKNVSEYFLDAKIFIEILNIVVK